MLVVVICDHLFIQRQMAHAGPFVLGPHRIDLSDQPNDQPVLGGQCQPLMELRVRLTECRRVACEMLHLFAQFFEPVEILTAAMQDTKAADMRLQRESRVDQFQRIGFLDRAGRGFFGRELHIRAAAALGRDQTFFAQSVQSFAQSVACDIVSLCKFSGRWEFLPLEIGAFQDFTSEDCGDVRCAKLCHFCLSCDPILIQYDRKEMAKQVLVQKGLNFGFIFAVYHGVRVTGHAPLFGLGDMGYEDGISYTCGLLDYRGGRAWPVNGLEAGRAAG